MCDGVYEETKLKTVAETDLLSSAGAEEQFGWYAAVIGRRWRVKWDAGVYFQGQSGAGCSMQIPCCCPAVRKVYADATPFADTDAALTVRGKDE